MNPITDKDKHLAIALARPFAKKEWQWWNGKGSVATTQEINQLIANFRVECVREEITRMVDAGTIVKKVSQGNGENS